MHNYKKETSNGKKNVSYVVKSNGKFYGILKDN
jgi:hypothetical protein